jgi:hypothetical protein
MVVKSLEVLQRTRVSVPITHSGQFLVLQLQSIQHPPLYTHTQREREAERERETERDRERQRDREEREREDRERERERERERINPFVLIIRSLNMLIDCRFPRSAIIQRLRCSIDSCRTDGLDWSSVSNHLFIVPYKLS